MTSEYPVCIPLSCQIFIPNKMKVRMSVHADSVLLLSTYLVPWSFLYERWVQVSLLPYQKTSDITFHIQWRFINEQHITTVTLRPTRCLSVQLRIARWLSSKKCTPLVYVNRSHTEAYFELFSFTPFLLLKKETVFGLCVLFRRIIKIRYLSTVALVVC